MVKFKAKTVRSIVLLGDSDMMDLDRELTSLFEIEYGNMLNLGNMILDKEIPDEKTILERTSEFNNKTIKMIANMQAKLDMLVRKDIGLM